MLDDRKLAILRAIVTDYVSTREPVGSKALVERYRLDVSPATVRNDMAVLEEEGYIAQPHTSAGRIPTDKGYRLYVDRLGAVKPLSGAERRAIETFLTGCADVDDVVRRTVRLLAQVTQQVAIVQYPALSGTTIRHVDIVPLASGRALVIVVNSAGHVAQRPIETGDLDESAIAVVRAQVARAIVGLGSAKAVEALAVLAEATPGSLAASVIAALSDMIGADSSTRVMVGGVPNLTRFHDQFEAMKPVLEALEEQVVLLRLLGETGAPGDVQVRIGHENAYEPLHAASVVASGYGGAPSVPWATLGVVGPTRMDYPSTMAAVRAIARYVGRFLSEG